MKALWNDEAGVILSAELVLIGTILVLGMIAGLVELQHGVVAELADLSDALGNLDQSYNFSGIGSLKDVGVYKGRTYGAAFVDAPDICDCSQLEIVCTDTGEQVK